VIEDDGRGLSALQPDDQHYGLSIMRERANSLGGELALEPRQGGGTRVSVTFAPDRMAPEPAARGDA
jgi:two-component system nitrate/nitrite sensor histidine kinase NarX